MATEIGNKKMTTDLEEEEEEEEEEDEEDRFKAKPTVRFVVEPEIKERTLTTTTTTEANVNSSGAVVTSSPFPSPSGVASISISNAGMFYDGLKNDQPPSPTNINKNLTVVEKSVSSQVEAAATTIAQGTTIASSVIQENSSSSSNDIQATAEKFNELSLKVGQEEQREILSTAQQFSPRTQVSTCVASDITRDAISGAYEDVVRQSGQKQQPTQFSPKHVVQLHKLEDLLERPKSPIGNNIQANGASAVPHPSVFPTVAQIQQQTVVQAQPQPPWKQPTAPPMTQVVRLHEQGATPERPISPTPKFGASPGHAPISHQKLADQVAQRALKNQYAYEVRERDTQRPPGFQDSSPVQEAPYQQPKAQFIPPQAQQQPQPIRFQPPPPPQTGSPNPAATGFKPIAPPGGAGGGGGFQNPQAKRNPSPARPARTESPRVVVEDHGEYGAGIGGGGGIRNFEPIKKGDPAGWVTQESVTANQLVKGAPWARHGVDKQQVQWPPQKTYVTTEAPIYQPYMASPVKAGVPDRSASPKGPAVPSQASDSYGQQGAYQPQKQYQDYPQQQQQQQYQSPQGAGGVAGRYQPPVVQPSPPKPPPPPPSKPQQQQTGYGTQAYFHEKYGPHVEQKPKFDERRTGSPLPKPQSASYHVEYQQSPGGPHHQSQVPAYQQQQPSYGAQQQPGYGAPQLLSRTTIGQYGPTRYEVDDQPQQQQQPGYQSTQSYSQSTTSYKSPGAVEYPAAYIQQRQQPQNVSQPLNLDTTGSHQGSYYYNQQQSPRTLYQADHYASSDVSTAVAPSKPTTSTPVLPFTRQPEHQAYDEFQSQYSPHRAFASGQVRPESHQYVTSGVQSVPGGTSFQRVQNISHVNVDPATGVPYKEDIKRIVRTSRTVFKQ